MPEGIVAILRFFLVQSTNSNMLKICTAKVLPSVCLASVMSAGSLMSVRSDLMHMSEGPRRYQEWSGFRIRKILCLRQRIFHFPLKSTKTEMAHSRMINGNGTWPKLGKTVEGGGDFGGPGGGCYLSPAGSLRCSPRIGRSDFSMRIHRKLDFKSEYFATTSKFLKLHGSQPYVGLTKKLYSWASCLSRKSPFYNLWFLSKEELVPCTIFNLKKKNKINDLLFVCL